MWPRISTINVFQSPAARAGIGFGLAIFAQLLSLLLVGAGHGWVAPLYLSVALWFLIPLTMLVAWPTAPASRAALLVIASIAVAADVLLINRTFAEANAIREYVQVNRAVGLTIIGLWLALWFFWQMILLYSLIIGPRRADVAD